MEDKKKEQEEETDWGWGEREREGEREIRRKSGGQWQDHGVTACGGG